jgi:mannosyl-3-phosphoglycerate phosphatase
MKIIIFTDLDGTLLDAETYSFEAALPALRELKDKNIPLVICSSKTRKEIEYYRKKLDNTHPFISENGGGIFIPKGYFGFRISGLGFEENDYLTVRLGAKYSDLRKAIMELRQDGFNIKGFGDMTVEELADTANMTIDEAEMAKERDFDEPFLFEGDNDEAAGLFQKIKEKGFNYTRGRFFHILGDSDKGKAVAILTGLYKKEPGGIQTIAVGDSPNDLPMLKNADIPVIVQKPDGSYEPSIRLPTLRKADGIGPQGWNKAVLEVIRGF